MDLDILEIYICKLATATLGTLVMEEHRMGSQWRILVHN
jgi:hypothetical protein